MKKSRRADTRRLRHAAGALILVSSSACGSSGGGLTLITLDGSSDAPRLIILSDSGTDTGTGDGAGGGDTGIDAPIRSPQVAAVPLIGCVPSEYSALMTVGGSQQFQLAVDTGSGSLGIASTQCPTCGVSPEYTPGASAVDEGMMALSEYGTGSWSGEIYQDTVSPAAADSAAVRLVAIESQSMFFEPVQCAGSNGPQGIVGFGPGTSAVQGTNAFFDELVAATGIPNVFATELCGSSGTLWLGGYDPTFTTAAPQYVPFSTDFLSQVYYAVNLSSITVDGVTTDVASSEYPDSVVDTGTSVFILGTQAFAGITGALAADTAFQQVFGGASAAASFLSSPQNCTSLSQTKAELDAMLPPFTLNFGNIQVKAAPTESYLIQYDGQWCPTMDQTPQGQDTFPFGSIMGSPLLRSNVIIFDRANSRIGFAPHTPCPG